MVTSQHEAAHRIFHERPELVSSVFRILGVPFPERVVINVMTSDTTEIRPVERRVDSVLHVEPCNGGEPFLLAIEAQSRRDKDKERSWAYYQAYLQEKYQLNVLLLVLCKDQSTANWAAGPIKFSLGGWESMTLTPLVLGPDNVPVIVKPEEAETDLPLAVFSAITHGQSRRVTAILDALARALGKGERKTLHYYALLVDVGLGNTPARKVWRDFMAIEDYFPGQITLVTESRQEGEAAGFIKGEAEGEAKGRADFVLRLMAMRGMELSADEQKRVHDCKDLETLSLWFDRAATVSSAEELFAEKEVAEQQGVDGA